MKNVIIHEVGLRDGLQMESEIVPTITKVEWVRLLASSGIDIIQLGSFVNPKILPQMADTDELFAEAKAIKFQKKLMFSALVLNEKGFERALNAGVEFVCTGVSASETHSKKNTGLSTNEALRRVLEIAKEAKTKVKKIQVSVQSAFGCGYEGNIPEERVYSIVEKYFENNINNISLADTAGMANPKQVERMCSKIRDMNSKVEIACHFHNTYGLGMVNIYVAMQNGVELFETAFGGLGGCPFTKQAAGNVSTEDFVYMLQKMNLRTDIDIHNIVSVAKYASGFFIKDLPGYIYKIWR